MTEFRVEFGRVRRHRRGKIAHGRISDRPHFLVLIEKAIHLDDDGCELCWIFFLLRFGLQDAPAFGFIGQFHDGQSSVEWIVTYRCRNGEQAREIIQYG